MTRFGSLIVLAALWAAPALAQSPFADPTVWVSASSGFVAWAPSAFEFGERDNVVSSFSVAAMSPRWLAQGGLQVSDYFNPVFPVDPFVSLSGSREREGPTTYRSLYAVAGPHASSRWFMGGIAAGPALTWGTRAATVPVCPPGVETCVWAGPLLLESERYLNPGLAGSVQGFVRLDGRVWLGGETMLVANAASTHLTTRLALRVDLLRPGR